MKGIAKIAAGDAHASALLSRARDCAEIYLLVSKRQKGCDGMGELAMIREEFGETLNVLIKYCKEKKYLPGDFHRDLDTAAAELSKIP